VGEKRVSRARTNQKEIERKIFAARACLGQICVVRFAAQYPDEANAGPCPNALHEVGALP
jgi:hypothetical protein